MTGLKHIRRLLLGVVLIIVVGYVLMNVKYQFEIPVYQVYSCLKLFIQEHQRMPVSQQELEEKGYLMVEMDDQKSYYSLRCDIIEVITRVPSKNKLEGDLLRAPFRSFSIQYGIDKDDLVKKNGVLYNKTTGEAVLLFTGSRFSLLSGTYRKLSAVLYDELVKVSVNGSK